MKREKERDGEEEKTEERERKGGGEGGGERPGRQTDRPPEEVEGTEREEPHFTVSYTCIVTGFGQGHSSLHEMRGQRREGGERGGEEKD